MGRFDEWDEEDEEIDSLYHSFDIRGEPWPDSYQPQIWTDGTEFLFATSAEQLLGFIQEAYETDNLEIPQSIEGWRQLELHHKVWWEDWDECKDFQFDVEELLLIGRLTGMGVAICGDTDGPFWMWGGVNGWE